MTKTLEQIWIDRSYPLEGRRVPTFWNPTPLVIDDTTDPKYYDTLARLVALGMVLELPVGEMVSDQMKLIPGLNLGVVNSLLKAAVADEARHYKGMSYAKQALLDVGVCPKLFEQYEAAAEYMLSQILDLPYPTITLAALLEVTVFLPSLALMRIIGGSAFNELSVRISQDEYNHTAVNSALSTALGYPLAKCNLWHYIQRGLLSFINFDLETSLAVLVLRSSDELWDTGVSPTLNQLTAINSYTWKPPFEAANSALYNRSLA